MGAIIGFMKSPVVIYCHRTIKGFIGVIIGFLKSPMVIYCHKTIKGFIECGSDHRS